MIFLILSSCICQLAMSANIGLGWTGFHIKPSSDSEESTVTETLMTESIDSMATSSAPMTSISSTHTESLSSTTFPTSTTSSSPSSSSIACPDPNQSTFQLSRSSWWNCKGHVVVCFNKVIEACRANLVSDTCDSGSCYVPHLPSHIKTLEQLAIQYKHYQEQHGNIDNDNSNLNSTDSSNNNTTTSNTNTGRIIDTKCKRALFTEYMELLANIAVQKSRFCHLDFDILTHLSELVERQFILERKCLSGMVDVYPSSSPMTNGTMTGGTIVTDHNGTNAYFPEGSNDINGNSTSYEAHDYNQHVEGIMEKLQQINMMVKSNGSNSTNTNTTTPSLENNSSNSTINANNSSNSTVASTQSSS